MSRIYTAGYLGKSPEQLLSFLEAHDAVLYDIRYSPFSRDPHWTKSAMIVRFGARYQHVNAFGNVNYKNGGPVELVDPLSGLSIVESETRSIVLLCACRHAAQCHRSTVATLLREHGYHVEEREPPERHEAQRWND